LVESYKDGLISKWGIKKFNLDDLYIRFFRLAERRINQLGRGIVAYISNYSFVSEPSYVVMREKLLETFDKIWVENMHGDRNKSEYAPDGRTSETIFAMRGFSPGIRQGVVTTLAVKTGKANEAKIIRFRDDKPLDLYSAVSSLIEYGEDSDLTDDLLLYRLEEGYQTAFINPAALDYISVPTHKFEFAQENLEELEEE
jgi:predicted helicase